MCNLNVKTEIRSIKMVGRKRKSDVKSRLGKTYLPKAKPKTGRIRDARDVLKKKGSLKGRINKPSNEHLGRPKQTTTMRSQGRIRRLMPLKEILTETKKVKHTNVSAKSNTRTLSLSSGSLRVTTKQPELCRKTIVSSNSLKIVTPSTSISKTDASETNPRRTLKNELYSSSVSNVFEEDLRTSSPNLSFTSLTEERPMIRRPGTRPSTQNATEQKSLTKIVVTNLHPRVIQADITELFGAVGPLTSVKLENSVAEVVFVKATDASNAYHKYHNRMLDGQAMKCTLGLAHSGVERTKEGTSINYSGAELVYPPASSRPVVFQVRI